MAVKERKTKAASPPTMEQLAETKMRDRIVAYRALVARAAADERLTGEDLEQASGLLDDLGLPPLSWARDVDAQRQFATAAADAARLDEAEPARAERLREIAERLKAIEAEVQALRVERHDLSDVQVMRHVRAIQRQNELTANHPHVLDDIERATAFRLQAKQRRPATPTADPLVGWSR